MKIDPYYQQRSVTLDSGNISFMWILAVVLKILCKFSLDLRIPVPIVQVCYGVLAVKIVAFVDDSCQLIELFLELTLYVVTLSRTICEARYI